MSQVKEYIRWLIRRTGWEVRRFDGFHAPVARRALLLQHDDITLVLDVGANIGQYGSELRKSGYRGRIVSFEPLSVVLPKLNARAGPDPGWDVMPIALGDRVGTATINVASENQCSSFRTMLPTLESRSPVFERVGVEDIEVRTLDDVLDSIAALDDRVLLKMDVQGFEKNVLVGAEESIHRIQAVQTEVSLVALYDDEATFTEMLLTLQSFGFKLMSVEPTMVDETGRMMQADAYFSRRGV